MRPLRLEGDEEVVKGRTTSAPRARRSSAYRGGGGRDAGRVWAPAKQAGLASREEFAPSTTSRSSATTHRVRRRSRATSGGVDQIASVAKAVAEAVSDDGVVTVKYADGMRRQGPVHAVREHEVGKARGRARDLQKEYTQIPITAPQASLSVAVLWHPGYRAPRYYGHRALPFEARNAVFVFGSMARTLAMILTSLFWLILPQYVDDYPQVEPIGSEASASEVAVKVLELLRWTPKRRGGTVPAFGWKFAALGVIGNVEKVMEERVEVQDKPERILRVVAIIEPIVAAGRAAPGDVEAEGCLAYTHAQCFGRCGAVPLRYLSRLAAGPAKLVDDETELQLSVWPKYLQEARPRTAKLNDKRPQGLVFADEVEDRGQRVHRCGHVRPVRRGEGQAVRRLRRALGERLRGGGCWGADWRMSPPRRIEWGGGPRDPPPVTQPPVKRDGTAVGMESMCSHKRRSLP